MKHATEGLIVIVFALVCTAMAHAIMCNMFGEPLIPFVPRFLLYVFLLSVSSILAMANDDTR